MTIPLAPFIPLDHSFDNAPLSPNFGAVKEMIRRSRPFVPESTRGKAPAVLA